MPTNFFFFRRRGFTLIEVLVVVAVLVVLSAIMATSLSAFRNSKVLDAAVEDTLTTISKARGDTLAGKNNTQYGVHFQSDRIVLFVGNTYVANDANNKTTMLDSALEISTISLAGGGVDVIFDRLTGNTSQSGTVVIRVASSPVTAHTITISGTGVAS